MRETSSALVEPETAPSVAAARCVVRPSPRPGGRSFADTALYVGRRRTDPKGILESLALLPEAVRISSIARAKGFKEDTILSWLREAGRHAQEVEAILLGDYRMSRAQIDALWTYVGHKGQRGGMKRASEPGVLALHLDRA